MDFGKTRAQPASRLSWQLQTAPSNTCSKNALITHSRQSICYHAVEIELEASISTFCIVRFLLRNTCKTSLKRVGLSTSTDSPTRCSVTSFVRHISMPTTKWNDRKAWRHSLCLPGALSSNQPKLLDEVREPCSNVSLLPREPASAVGQTIHLVEKSVNNLYKIDSATTRHLDHAGHRTYFLRHSHVWTVIADGGHSSHSRQQFGNA